MNAPPALPPVTSLRDLHQLAAILHFERAWEPVPLSAWRRREADPPPCTGSAVVGRLGSLSVVGAAAAAPARAARKLAGLLFRRGEPAVVLAFDPAGDGLALSVAFEGLPVLILRPADDESVLATCIERLARLAPGPPITTAASLAEILSMEGIGRRFFHAFERQLERVAQCIGGPGPECRSLALLQLNRVLFLYFVQSKGWLDGQPDFLRRQVDRCLASGKEMDRHLLKPLFFGTLNRPAADRSRSTRAFGRIPFLNGGLFEPHPLERRRKPVIPNLAWRAVFDDLFERFQFTTTEGTGGAIAPDMLGRVFEGVMAPRERRGSGTFYTPPALVNALLDECLLALVSGAPGIAPDEAARMLAERNPRVRRLLSSVTLLDPAVGSGAFLLAALERLADLLHRGGESGSGLRRRILQTSLFGVDINPTAVRLTELRLWLAVIAAERPGIPERVAPLPNLDCLVRQGDSLADPLGMMARMPVGPGALGEPLANLRKAFIASTGVGKRAAARTLRQAEQVAMRACLDRAEAALTRAIRETIADARTPDLFGVTRRPGRVAAERLRGLRQRLLPVRQAGRRLEQEGEVGWFQYESHFADVFAHRGGFDIVIGNPPWVRAEKLPARVREHLAARYGWWRSTPAMAAGYRHQPDLAIAFMERSHELAAPNGVVGLLVPVKTASSAYASRARQALSRDVTLHTVADLGSQGGALFEATVYPMAIVSSKRPPPPHHRVRTRLGQPVPAGPAQSDLDGGPWILRGGGGVEISRELALRFPTVASRFPIHLGVKTGDNRIFLNPPASLEPGLIRPAIRGRDTRPFRLLRTVPLLWPCTDSGVPLERLPARAGRYLAHYDDRLRARADYRSGPAWALFRTAGAAPGPRVIWADLARRLGAVPLEPERVAVPLNTCYAIRADETQCFALAAWLNSSWMGALARLTADPASGGFRRFNARIVGGLPLPASVPGSSDLAAWARRATTHSFVQAELDDLAAMHLDLPPGSLRTLGNLA